MDWQLTAAFLLMLMVFFEGGEIYNLKKRIRALELNLLRSVADALAQTTRLRTSPLQIYGWLLFWIDVTP